MKKIKQYQVIDISPIEAHDPGTPYQRQEKTITFEDVMHMFQETDKKFQETDKQFKETDKKYKEIAERFQETDKQFKETDKKFQETDKQFKETDKKFQETDKQFKETARRINKLDTLFTTQWGKLMESLVEGDLLQLLRAKGINVHRTFQRVKDDERLNRYEFDIVAENSDEAVFVEVKTTLRTDDVSYFLEKLEMVKTWMPKYHDVALYGAVAYLTADSNSHVMAEKRGLFVIRATGSSANIINKDSFVPKKF